MISHIVRELAVFTPSEDTLVRHDRARVGAAQRWLGSWVRENTRKLNSTQVQRTSEVRCTWTRWRGYVIVVIARFTRGFCVLQALRYRTPGD